MIFIRPWFLLLLLVPLLFWLLKGKLAPSSILSKYIDERLLPFVTVRFKNAAGHSSLWYILLIWTALVLAGAGPAYEKISTPVKISAPAHVIVMDMSPAMRGETLETAKRKLYDLLGALRGHQAALVVYDEKGYVVSPLTQDLNIIRTMIPALRANVMPRYGNRADLGFEKAVDLFKNVGLEKGQIIFLSAGGYEANKLEAIAKDLPYEIATIGFGGTQETPISLPDGGFLRNADGSVVFAKLNVNFLKRLGTYTPATLNDEDIQAVLSSFSPQEKEQGQADAVTAEVWHDLGPTMLIITAPFFAFLFRRGVVYVFIFSLMSSSMMFASSALAGEWFFRPDQQAYKMLQEGVEAYHSGNYESAKTIFENLTLLSSFSTDALYNKGNALVHLNDIKGAIEAYESVLKMNPEHANAKYNKEYLQKQLPPDAQEQKKSNNQSGTQNSELTGEQNSDSNHNLPDNNIQNGHGDQSEQEFGKNQNSQNESQNENTKDGKDVQNEVFQEGTPHGEVFKENQNINENSSDNMTRDFIDQNKDNQSTQKTNPPKVLPSANKTPSTSQNLSPQPEAAQNSADEQVTQNKASENTNELKNISSHETEQLPPPFSQSSLDQESAQLLYKIRQDPSRLLRYRLYQQWRQQDD